MAFDVQGARDAGYSDAEIAGFLGQQSGFDVDAATKAGYEPAEIVGFLSERAQTPTKAASPDPAAPSLDGIGLTATSSTATNSRPTTEVSSNNTSTVLDREPIQGELDGGINRGMRRADFEERRAPSTISASKGPANTRMADKGRLAGEEGMLSRAVNKARTGAVQGVAGIIRAGAEGAQGLGIPGASTVAGIAAETGAAARDFESGMGPPTLPEGFGPKSPLPYLQEMGEGAAASLIQAGGAGATLGARAVIPALSAMTTGQEYERARQAGMTPAEAIATAIPKGAFEAAGEKFTGLDKVAKSLGTLMTKGASDQVKREAGEVLLKAGVREVPGEVFTYLGQNGVDLIPGIGLNQDLTMDEFLSGLRDTVVQSSMMGGAMGGGALVVNRGRRDPIPSAQDIVRARWGDAFAGEQNAEPLAAIAAAPTVDDAIAAATAAVATPVKATPAAAQAVDNIAALLNQPTEPANASQPTAVPGMAATGSEPGGAVTAPGMAPVLGADGVAGIPVDTGSAGNQPTAVAGELGAGPAGAAAVDPQVAAMTQGIAALEAQQRAPAAPPTAPVATMNPEGTLRVQGDAKLILKYLKDNGITSVIPSAGGVTVGRSQSAQAQSLLQDFAPSPKIEASQGAMNEPITAAPVVPGEQAAQPQAAASELPANGVGSAGEVRADGGLGRVEPAVAAVGAAARNEAAIAYGGGVNAAQPTQPRSAEPVSERNVRADTVRPQVQPESVAAARSGTGSLEGAPADVARAAAPVAEAANRGQRRDDQGVQLRESVGAQDGPRAVSEREQVGGRAVNGAAVSRNAEQQRGNGRDALRPEGRSDDGDQPTRLDDRAARIADERARVEAQRPKNRKEVSRYNGKYGKGMSRDAAKLEAARLNRQNGNPDITYAAEEHGDPKLENPYAVVGREKFKPRAAPAAPKLTERERVAEDRKNSPAGRREAEAARTDEAAKPKYAFIEGGLSPRSTEQVVSEFKAAGMDLNVADTVDDLPAKGRARVKSEGLEGVVRGIYDRETDKAWIVRENIGELEEAFFVGMHEAFHRGIARTFPDAKPILNYLELNNKTLRDKARAFAQEHNIGRLEAIEEVLADMAGEGKAADLKGWDQFIAFLKGILQKVADGLNISVPITDKMVEDFVAGIRRAGLPEAIHVETRTEAAPMMSRGDGNPVPPNLRASQTVDENGMPEFTSGDVYIGFAQPTERMEFIPDGPDQRMLNMAIMGKDGAYLGFVELQFDGDKLKGLYDIEIEAKGGGTGAKVIEALLASNPDATINISNVVPAARGFWAKVGVPEQNLEEGAAYDGDLNWQTYAESPAGTRRGASGKNARPASQGRKGDEPAKAGQDQGDEGGPGTLFSRKGLTVDQRADGIPTADAPELSPWRDATGRLQFAPGDWLYDKLGAAAGPMLAKLGLKAASPTLRRQLRAMKLTVEKAQETAAAVAAETQKLTPEERDMVSDLIEQEMKVGTIPPDHAVRLAALINSSMESQTDELVRLGMLTKDSADMWRGKYLPRFYKSKLKGQAMDVWADALSRMMGRQKVMAGIKGKHLRGRGLYETIPVNQLDNYKEMGWEVRDPDYSPTSDDVQVWRDFTREERDKMGEIRDAGFRFVMGYMQTQRDIALGRMFEGLANDPDISSKRETEKFTAHVPDGTVPGTGAKRYGMLAGKWVSKETMSHLSQIEESQSEAWRMYRKALGIWKEGKTVLNPVSHVNNMLSNMTMAHFAGVSYLRADKYLAAAKDFATKDPRILEAKEAGLFLGNMSDAELMNTLPEDLKMLVRQQESKATKIGRSAFNVMTFFLRKPMGWAYQAEDTFFRYLLYKEARDRGMEKEDAVDWAQKFIFTYDDLPKGARMIRDFGLPFFSYTYKAVPALLHTALTHPARMAAPAAILWGINAAAYAIAAGDDDDSWEQKLKRYLTDANFREEARKKEKLEREHLPPWMKGTTALATPKTLRLGMDEVTKLPLFIDISRIIPGGDLFDVSPNAGGIPLPQPITPSHPIFTAGVAMLANKDLFRGKDLVDKNDTRGEAAEKRLKWLWTQMTPAITAGNYHWDRGMNALAQASGGKVEWLPDAISEQYTGVGNDGLPVQPKYAAAQTFGIKVRPIDLDTAERIENSLKQKMIRDIDAEMRSMRRLNAKGAVSDSVLEKAREKANEKKDRLRQGLTVDGDEKP